jgi:hypothetical protein
MGVQRTMISNERKDKTTTERDVIRRAAHSIRWIMESGYSRQQAEAIVLRAHRLWPDMWRTA